MKVLVRSQVWRIQVLADPDRQTVNIKNDGGTTCFIASAKRKYRVAMWDRRKSSQVQKVCDFIRQVQPETGFMVYRQPGGAGFAALGKVICGDLS